MGLLDKVKDAAGKATEQAKHGLAVGKEKIEDAKLKKQIDELLQQIGALVVADKRGQAPDDLDSQIEAKLGQIDELEAAIEANNVEAAAAETATSETPAAEPAVSADES